MKLIRNLAWKFNKPTIVLLMSIFWKRRFAFPTRMHTEGGLIHITQIAGDEKATICVWQPKRVSRYFIGINARLDRILSEYCLEEIAFIGGQGIIIDIGLNVGEFPMAIERKFPGKFEYIGFEPSEKESLAAKENLRGLNHKLIRQPLWFETTTLEFYELNEYGDSSLIRPSLDAVAVMMISTTLDESLSHLIGKRIELLKLEAEGAEPEVLKGGGQILPYVAWVAADLGPERGIAKEETFDVCHKILSNLGFKLWATNTTGRKAYLYKNMKLQSLKES